MITTAVCCLLSAEDESLTHTRRIVQSMEESFRVWSELFETCYMYFILDFTQTGSDDVYGFTDEQSTTVRRHERYPSCSRRVRLYDSWTNPSAHQIYATGADPAPERRLNNSCGRSRRGRVVLCAFDAHGESAHLARVEVLSAGVSLIRPLEHPRGERQ